MPRLKSTYQILVADDDPVARELVAVALDGRGWKLIFAEDGNEALSILEEMTPDLSILDIQMPGRSGIEVCTHLKKQAGKRFSPVIFLTCEKDINQIVSGLEIGADDYITKPFSLAELEARVHALLRTSDLIAELAETREKLASAEKNLLLAELAGATAHELGQPLTALLLQIDMLRSSIPGQGNNTEIIENISALANQMRQTLEKIRSTDTYRTEKYAGGTRIVSLGDNTDKK